jgi:hypothetical protein
MSPGFSNGGVDTFDERKQYVGVRLQQGVPLLDRDWNELEDIRRYYERRLRELNIGSGVPDRDGFAIKPPVVAADNDVLIAAGSCSVAGLDVRNAADVLFSAQGDRKPLPPPSDTRGDTLVLYLEPSVVRIGSSAEPTLGNTQDINMETCMRDQLRWAVRAAAVPAPTPATPAATATIPPRAYVLAEINRPAKGTRIIAAMIVDRRRVGLNLASAIDRIAVLEKALADLLYELRGVPAVFDVATFSKPAVFA